MKTEPTEAIRYIMDNEFGDGIMDIEDAEEAVNIAFKEGQSSPKIKQLEWDEVWEGYESAKTPFGFYVVRPSIDNKEFRMVNLRKITQTYSTLSEAKVAAQADFEQRIKECLE